jgi:hypothetical protein
MMCVLGRSGPRVVSLLPCFRGGVWGVKYCWNRCSSILAFETFIILFLCDLLVDNSTFSKMCIFKNLTFYTDYGGYVVKRNSTYTHIKVNDHIVSDRSVFVHG